jgi:hypothetical protein
MHNCKTTQSELIDLVLAEGQRAANPPETTGDQRKLERLRTALANCGDCRAEYTALRRTLSTFEQAAQAAVPGAAFWPGYHSRLAARLTNAAATNLTLFPEDRPSQRVWSLLKAFSNASVRIPVPVALAILLLSGIAGISAFVLPSSGSKQPEPSSPAVAVVTKTIEVPLVKERLVTRVVYVTRNRKQSPARAGDNNTLSNSATTAQIAPEPANTVFNLADFKPTDHVKLTIIKGSYHDEK